MTLDIPLVLVAAAALINQKNEILLQQRPKGKSMAGLWEFPGGKVEPGESPEYCLYRELLEELGITCALEDFEPLTFASHSYDDFHLLMPLYLCRKWQGELETLENQRLQWRKPQEMSDLPMPAADYPLVDALKEQF